MIGASCAHPDQTTSWASVVNALANLNGALSLSRARPAGFGERLQLANAMDVCVSAL
jgi:hypothetical protein